MIIKEQHVSDGWECFVMQMEPADVEQVIKSTGGYARVEQLDAIARPWRTESWYDVDAGTNVQQEYECPADVEQLALDKCDEFVAIKVEDYV